MRAALYLRVSTPNGQTTDNQRLELEAVAERHGWQVVESYDDAGRLRRPGPREAASL
jgi:DNA invertase Pin-like site-specific DNA recombinase